MMRSCHFHLQVTVRRIHLKCIAVTLVARGLTLTVTMKFYFIVFIYLFRTWQNLKKEKEN